MNERLNPIRDVNQSVALWCVVLGVLLAFGLRIYRIDAPALRGDEAFSITFARQTPAEMLSRFVSSTEPHPPLSFFVLHYWRRLAGESEFALRFTSAFAGVLIVPLIYVLGRALFDHGVGVAAAALTAFNPFLIWHAQEARMYAMLVAWSIASTILFLRVLTHRGFGWPAVYGVVTALAVYTHYYTFLLLAFQAMFVALGVVWPQLLPCQVSVPNARAGAAGLAAQRARDSAEVEALAGRSRWRPMMRWLAGAALIGLLYAPWLLASLDVLTAYRGSARSSLPFLAPIYRSLSAFGQGQTLPQDAALWLLPLWAGMFLAGIAIAWRRDKRPALFLLLYFLLPWTIVFVDSLRRPAFDERYFMVSSPPFYVLVALCLLALYRWRRALFVGIVVLVVGACSVSLYNHYHDPVYARAPDWRALDAFFRERVRPGDVVVANYPDPAVRYYYDFDAPWYVLPEAYPVDRDRTSAALAALVRDRERIWLTPQRWATWDAEGLVEGWLDEHAERAGVFQVDRFFVLLYHTPRRFEADMRWLDVEIEGEIRLLGYLVRDGSGDAVDRLVVAPGDAVRLTLYWQPASKLAEDVVVFAHLLDPSGWLRGQQDNQPRQGTYPTQAWVPGERVVDVYPIPLAPDSPSGTYAVEVGMYRPDDGVRLQVSGTDADVGNRRVLLRDLVTVVNVD